jgi:hypothetical protein
MNDIKRVHEIAALLLREGFADNEPDAVLLAIRIVIAAAQDVSRSDRSSDAGG